MKMISIVCAYNNETILKDWLIKSIGMQVAECEMIMIDTAKYGFRSAAEALNFGGSRASGKYIMFVHQDVALMSSGWLVEAEKMLDGIADLGIAGAVGSAEEGGSVSERMRNMIIHGDDREAIGTPISSPAKVQTVDELVMIIPRRVFQEYRFDKETCGGWHLYGADYCLTMLAEGKDVYVIPLSVIHRSKGASVGNRVYSLSSVFNCGLSRDYYRTLARVLRKHKENFKWVCVTPAYGRWNTAEPLLIQRVKYLLGEIVKYSAGRIKLSLLKRQDTLPR